MDSNAPAEPRSGRSDNEESRPPLSLLHPDRIAKNTSYLTIALIIQKVLSLGYFVYLSRTIGPANSGQYLTALAITTVFGIFIDIGLSQVLIRETAKQQEKAGEYLSATIALKLLTACIAYAAALVYVRIFDYTSLTRSLVTLTGLIMILDSFTLTFYAIFRGHQRLQYEAIGTVLNKILVIAVGVFGLSRGLGVRFVVLAILAGSIFNFFFSFAFLIKKLGFRPLPRWNSSTLRFLGKIAIPFAIAGVFVTVYGYLDQLLLSNPLLVGERGPSFVGWYGTAYKLAFALQFVPAAVAAAIFPAMSAYFVSSKELLAKTFNRAMFYLLIISVPLAVGIFVLADTIILKAYKKAFEASIIPLQILIVSIVFVFLNYPVGYLLNATDRQTRNTVHIGIVMVLNLVLNLLLIPRYTFIGAAVASTISSVVLLSLGLYVARKIVQLDIRLLLSTAWKTLVCSLTMAALIHYLDDRLNIFVLIALAATWYFGSLFLLRGYKASDGMKIYHSVVRKIS